MITKNLFLTFYFRLFLIISDNFFAFFFVLKHPKLRKTQVQFTQESERKRMKKKYRIFLSVILNTYSYVRMYVCILSSHGSTLCMMYEWLLFNRKITGKKKMFLKFFFLSFFKFKSPLCMDVSEKISNKTNYYICLHMYILIGNNNKR